MANTETNNKVTEKQANASVDKAIKSRASSEKDFVEAIVFSMQCAAIHGQTGPLTRLWNGVSISDRESIRLYRVNVAKKFGTYVTDDGKQRTTDFLTFDKDAKKFGIGKSNDSDKASAIANCKKMIAESDFDSMAKIPLTVGRDTSAERQAQAFDLWDSLAKLIKRAAREGENKSILSKLNAFIPDENLRVDVNAAASAANQALDKARQTAEKKGYVLVKKEDIQTVESISTEKTPATETPTTPA